MPPLRNATLYNDAWKIAPNAQEQFCADVARYEILERFGGLYVDADMECLKSFEPWVTNLDLVAAWELDGVWINNALLGAVAAHPFLTKLVDCLPASVAANRGKPPNRISGPRYLTTLFKELKPAMTILPAFRVYPYLWNELHREGAAFPEAWCRHVWNNRRKGRRRTS